MRLISLLSVICYLGVLACGSTPGHVVQEETPIGRRAPAPPHPGWKPPVTLRQAVGLVDDYVVREKVDVSSHYLSEVRMISNHRGKEGEGPLWYFFWSRAGTAAGNQLEFTVAMDGTVTRLASW